MEQEALAAWQPDIEKHTTVPVFFAPGTLPRKLGSHPGASLTSTSGDTSGLGPAKILLTRHDVDHCKLGPGGARARGDATTDVHSTEKPAPTGGETGYEQGNLA